MIDPNCEKCNTVIGTCLYCCGCKEHCNCGNFTELIQSALDEAEMNVSLEDLDHEWGKMDRNIVTFEELLLKLESMCEVKVFTSDTDFKEVDWVEIFEDWFSGGITYEDEDGGHFDDEPCTIHRATTKNGKQVVMIDFDIVTKIEYIKDNILFCYLDLGEQ